MRSTAEGPDHVAFSAPMKFNCKNGRKDADFDASPTSIDVHRPGIKSMAYVVRGEHRKQLVKITEIVRNKGVITGFKAKRDPFVGRAPTIFVKVNEVTKVEEVPEEQHAERSIARLPENELDPDPKLLRFIDYYPNY